MDTKTIKRIVYAILAAVLLVVGGREMAVAGFTPTTIVAGSAGIVFLLSAITGAG